MDVLWEHVNVAAVCSDVLCRERSASQVEVDVPSLLSRSTKAA